MEIGRYAANPGCTVHAGEQWSGTLGGPGGRQGPQRPGFVRTVRGFLVCFSLEADLVVGLSLLPVAAVSLREVRHVREAAFASLPLFFAAHQLIEAVVWASLSGDVSVEIGQVAAMAYLVFALPVLPVLVPVAVLLLEPRGSRWRAVPFVCLGAVVATYFAFAVLLTGPVEVVAEPHALSYVAPIDDAVIWTGLYIVAVIGASVLSGYRSIVAFGVVNCVGLTVVAIAYAQAFASLWCVWAALSSVLVALHMFRRRRLDDGDRLHAGPKPLATS